MIYSGTYKEYHFLQTAKDGCDFARFVVEFEKLLIGKAVGILSFDGYYMKPTAEEYKRGWNNDDKQVALFDELNSQELKAPIFANCYDEWYLFDKPTKLKSNHIYVTYSGFRLINESEDAKMNNIISRFWSEILINNPMCFIIYGDNFIYGSKNKKEIAEIKLAWS